MRVFLAATTAGMTKTIREESFRIGKPKYLLETFFAGERTCSQVLEDTTTENFLLDSGAFSYMSGAQCSKQQLTEYMDRYPATKKTIREIERRCKEGDCA